MGATGQIGATNGTAGFRQVLPLGGRILTQNTKQILIGIVAILILIVGLMYARDPNGMTKSFRQGFHATSGGSSP